MHIFLDGIDKNSDYYPKVGVIGIAGPVTNNTVDVTNTKWPVCNGYILAEQFGFDKFIFINDFEAAGYGVLNLDESMFVRLNSNDTKETPDSLKAVIGPGTGLGQCFLTKSQHSPFYEVHASEGGHCEFSPRFEEDFELLAFAKNFIENSNNVENLRAKGHIPRCSVERLVAGPAVPLLYDFFRQRFP